MVNDLVECRSDGDYAGTPLVVYWEGHKRVVKKVLASWRSPEGKSFRVITQGEIIFECSYSEVDDIWKVEMI